MRGKKYQKINDMDKYIDIVTVWHFENPQTPKTKILVILL